MQGQIRLGAKCHRASGVVRADVDSLRAGKFRLRNFLLSGGKFPHLDAATEQGPLDAVLSK